jgi:hypothetical protein
MEINRTGPRSSPVENSTQRAEQNSSEFRNSAAQAIGSDSDVQPTGVPAGITRAELADANKNEEIVKRSFGEMIDDASRELGLSVSGTQKQGLLEFLGNDPVMSGKLLNYLEQSIE